MVDTNEIRSIGARIRAELAKAVVGMDEVIEHLLVALLSRGHVLLEGVPGTA